VLALAGGEVDAEIRRNHVEATITGLAQEQRQVGERVGQAIETGDHDRVGFTSAAALERRPEAGPPKRTSRADVLLDREKLPAASFAFGLDGRALRRQARARGGPLSRCDPDVSDCGHIPLIR